MRKGKRLSTTKANRTTQFQETNSKTIPEKKQGDIGKSKASTSLQQRPLLDETIAQRERSLTSVELTSMSLQCDSTYCFQSFEFNGK